MEMVHALWLKAYIKNLGTEECTDAGSLLDTWGQGDVWAWATA